MRSWPTSIADLSRSWQILPLGAGQATAMLGDAITTTASNVYFAHRNLTGDMLKAKVAVWTAQAEKYEKI
jgi:hypothetical protein